MFRFVWLFLFLIACAPVSHDEALEADCPDLPDVQAPLEEAGAPDVAPPAPEDLGPAPEWPSVAWILTQPYNAPAPFGAVTCGRGHRAFDNPDTLFVSHPITGRCTFPCQGTVFDFTSDCATIDGRCDDDGFCVSIHVKGE